MPPKSYTHFISIPLKDPVIKANVQNLYNDIKNYSSSSILKDKNACVSPNTLHLTLAMLTLKSKNQIQAAVSLLQSLLPEINILIKSNHSNKPSIKLQKLSVMGRPGTTLGSVLYSNVIDSSNLLPTLENNSNNQSVRSHAPLPPDTVNNNNNNNLILHKICNLIITKFKAAGFVPDSVRPLLMHMTLINLRYAAAANNSSYVKKIDFTPIISQFGQFSSGSCRIDSIEIAKRFYFNHDGSYFSEGSINL
ncbi:hypothetical protein AYI70_g2832 [Smittium culicis]|uniref:A-kinase anchor protein 7-like phosphoesterase domain-containing protein n=1 Tax=Smittium culicis TaxID=133412 RepID=A0A1R1Y6J5_9FUNG|nr:hypothetical protein AYI70_g2832 [Smittium culicis]